MTLATLCAMAVPAKRGQWKTVTLADGSKVRVELRGDEFINYWQAEDGRRFVRNAATTKYELADMTKLRERAQALRKSINIKGGKQNAPARSATRAASSQYTGQKKGLVILIDFPDRRFTHGSPALYERILNEENFTDPVGFVGSVSDYFRDQSNDTFNLTFDVAGPYTMPEGYAYYGGDVPSRDANMAEMWRYALRAADEDVNYKDYDWNGDGQVEQVFFIYAGLGQANGGEVETIWPHKSAVANEDWTEYLVFDGVRVFDYACSCECQPAAYELEGDTYVVSETKIDGIGTICHEFSHCLGLADLYDIDYSGGYGMDAWDLMSSGSYNGNSFRPACYTGAERMWIGWKQPIELTEATEINGMKSLENGGESYIIRNDANPDEYYILDNRQPDGRWDAGLPGAGLLITHVDYDQGVWDSNGPNDNPNHQRCTPIPADGNYLGQYIENIAGDAYPYGSNNSLTNESTPAATVNTKNIDGTNYMNKPITDITQNPDGTISFNFGVQAGPLFYESFDKCIGKGGNDDDESLKGFVPDANNKLGQGELLTDNEGWAYSGSKGGAYNCAMFESSATTPEFEIDGKCTLTFRAGAIWDNKYTGNSAINLAVTGNAKLSTSQVKMVEYGFGDHSVDITGTGKIKITFSSDVTFVLDEVKVMSATATGINGVTVQPGVADKPADRRIYSIDGRYVGTDATQLPKGMYIRGGKKFIKR